jgi:hypothetical protein
MKEIGILMDDSTVSAEAESLGYKKVNGEYTNASSSARLRLKEESVEERQWSVWRESEGKRPSKNFERPRLRIFCRTGQKLLPTVLKLVIGQRQLIDKFTNCLRRPKLYPYFGGIQIAAGP